MSHLKYLYSTMKTVVFKLVSPLPVVDATNAMHEDLVCKQNFLRRMILSSITLWKRGEYNVSVVSKFLKELHG